MATVGRLLSVEHRHHNTPKLIFWRDACQPLRAIQNLTKVKVNAFKDSFVEMNYGEELVSREYY